MMRNVGIFLVVCGLLGPALLQRIRPGAGERPPTLTWALAEDGLRLCFFAGAALWLIGFLRSRRAKD